MTQILLVTTPSSLHHQDGTTISGRPTSHKIKEIAYNHTTRHRDRATCMIQADIYPG